MKRTTNLRTSPPPPPTREPNRRRSDKHAKYLRDIALLELEMAQDTIAEIIAQSSLPAQVTKILRTPGTYIKNAMEHLINGD